MSDSEEELLTHDIGDEVKWALKLSVIGLGITSSIISAVIFTNIGFF